MENNYMKMYSESYVIGEMQIKMTMSCHYTHILEQQKSKKNNGTSAGEGEE